ncbi:hypothetical protein BCR34DRAFT_602190 [Clohesyomyces aquaticus]|uniref:DRBM domain-containing protein n=1 Tax=Clohesyomyces aquaticus TaxID=1231657 RepID=A0A1Y1ZKJ9_9PLEO|nr:hypothetical protein BCR34DRAFT_602190 [Clohesyomyces aquaticus]
MATSRTTPYSQQLKEHCNQQGLPEPTWQDVSDRRGGRTAWSSIAVVNGVAYSARFWYDGAYVEQAREDAAERALATIRPTVNTPTSASHSNYYGHSHGYRS